MRKIRLLILFLFSLPAAVSVSAQVAGVVRGSCTPGLTDELTRGQTGQPKFLRAPNTAWDASRTYHQLVILVSFSDADFMAEDPRAYYNSMFNEPGYHKGIGVGCVADYFREQSGGLFNLQFDIYGPYKTSGKAQPYANPTSNTRNYGSSVMKEATLKMVSDNEVDFSIYDWDGDNKVDQVICIYAGIGGNMGEGSYGHVWPNTYSFGSTIVTPDGMAIEDYSCSAELWTENVLGGIGTICHEFSHCLGLPDIYPASGNTGYFSVADEWDLMDGGNCTNLGWCPPNYTALEKMLLGWQQPIELTAPTTVSGLKAVSDGGEAYLVRHTANEYLLLENRQWTGWDSGLPGRGLVIYHVDYDRTAWLTNRVNTVKGHFRFDLVHADNLDYEQWDDIQPRDEDAYLESPMIHNKHLSTSAYPWGANTELTDTSVPAAVMFNANGQGNRLLSKAITNISLSDDGLVSFDFMGGEVAAIAGSIVLPTNSSAAAYNVMGQRVAVPRRGLFIKNGKKYVKY